VNLGTKVRYDARRTLWREHLPSGHRRWSSQSHGQTHSPREGVIVGARTLANGQVSYGGWDTPTEFSPTAHFKAYLVAFDMRKNPVYVLPEDLEVLDS
jgi:hypothetical protein